MATKRNIFYLAQPSRESSVLRAKITFNGNTLYFPSGVSVNCAEWKKYGQKKLSKPESMKLSAIDAAITNALLYFERSFKTPTQEQFKEKVNEFLGGSNIIEVAKKDKNLIIYIEKFIEANKERKSKNTIKSYTTTLNKLLEFAGRNLTFDDITLAFSKKFTAWAQNKGYSRNYIGSHFKNICVFMGEAQNIEKLHKNEDYRQFKVEQETADSIYLSMEELEKIYHLDFKPSFVGQFYKNTDNNFNGNISRICRSLDLVRNKFLIGALTALRISDYNRLSVENIKDGVVTVVPKKGSNLRKPEPVKIPMHPIMKEIIDKGFDFNAQISEQKINLHIKEICKMAGITEMVTHYRTMGGKLVEMKSPKYELVSSHTARRSGATNMYLAGIPHGLIRVCTGHRTTEMLLKYIKVAYKEDNVQELKQFSYFGGSNENEKIIEHVKKTLQNNEEPLWLKMIKDEIS